MNYTLLVQRQLYPRDFDHIDPQREPELAAVFSHMLKVRLGWDDVESRLAYVAAACPPCHQPPITMWLGGPELITHYPPQQWRKEVIDLILGSDDWTGDVILYLLSDGRLPFKSRAFWKKIWEWIVEPWLNKVPFYVVSHLFVRTNNEWFAQQILSHIDVKEKLKWTRIVGTCVAFRHFLPTYRQSTLNFMACRGDTEAIVAAAYEAGGRMISSEATSGCLTLSAMRYYLSHPERYEEMGLDVSEWIRHQLQSDGGIPPLVLAKMMREFNLDMPSSFYSYLTIMEDLPHSKYYYYRFSLALLSYGYISSFHAPLVNLNIPGQNAHLRWHPEWTHHYYSDAFRKSVEDMLIIMKRMSMPRDLRHFLLKKIFNKD